MIPSIIWLTPINRQTGKIKPHKRCHFGDALIQSHIFSSSWSIILRVKCYIPLTNVLCLKENHCYSPVIVMTFFPGGFVSWTKYFRSILKLMMCPLIDPQPNFKYIFVPYSWYFIFLHSPVCCFSSQGLLKWWAIRTVSIKSRSVSWTIVPGESTVTSVMNFINTECKCGNFIKAAQDGLSDIIATKVTSTKYSVFYQRSEKGLIFIIFNLNYEWLEVDWSVK